MGTCEQLQRVLSGKVNLTAVRPINIPPYHDRPKEAGEVWRLQKGRRVAVCNLWTHPIGGEVRVMVDGELIRSESNRDGFALIDRGLEWKAQFQEKGWL